MSKRNSNPMNHVADLMSALMIIFLFIAISYMRQVSIQHKIVVKEKENMEKIAKTYEKVKYNIYEELRKEFEKELISWKAAIDEKNLSVVFLEPDIFFEKGKEELTPKFKNILDNFFPRYIQVLSQPKFKNEIEEIRIEGHTSSEWNSNSTELESYFNNMKLSQARTRSVLEYVMHLDGLKNYKEFLIKKVTANGLSYSRRIIIHGEEDKTASRRVEFRIRTTAEQKIQDILKTGKSNIGDEMNEN